MRDTTLYQHPLGLEEPWTVEKVDLDVWVGHPRRHRWPCPECGTACSLYDHAPERTWRHLDSCQFQTFLHARPPRVKCPEHGVRQVDLPWAEPKDRFTLLFESFAIQVLAQTTIEGACRILGIRRDEAWHLLNRAVERGLAQKEPRLIRYLGVDEKAAGRGQSNYITVACDAEAGVVDDVMMGRSKASLDEYLDALTPEQREALEAVAIDMHEAYIQAVKGQFPDRWDEMIVFDRFHIMQHMTKAVDQVRRAARRFTTSRFTAVRRPRVPASGRSSGANSRLDAIWRKARGYRNKARYRVVILFHLGGLPMDPVTH